MMRKLLSVAIIILVVLSSSIALAGNTAASKGKGPDDSAVPDDEDKIDIPNDWHGKTKIVIPKGELTQVVIIKYAKPFGQSNEQQPTIVEVGDPDNDGAQDGYELSGLSWKLSRYTNGVPYIINPSAAVANYGLTQSAVVGAVKNSLEAWDAAVDYDDYTPPDTITYTVELYSDNPTINNLASASLRRPDYKNVITWARIRPSSIIAIASMWYNTLTKELVDADIIFNTYFTWGIDPDGEGGTPLLNKMDIQNICTHEAGHWTGLNDLYNATYGAMTMYGYAGYEEVTKRSLEPGDIAGAQEVYKAYRQ